MTDNHLSLPSNVRRWLERSLAKNSPTPTRILNSQEGEIDVRGQWMPFTARTIYQREPASFLWQARLNILPGVWVKAEDGYAGQQEWGGSKLWGLIPMGGRKGPEVRAMQVVRSLAELPWKPQLALTLNDVEWSDSGDNNFAVQTANGTENIAVDFTLNDAGEIIKAASQRYYDVPDGFVQSPWHYEFSAHRDFDGVHMPAAAVATYEKQDGAWEYWRGKIIAVQVEN